MASDEEHGRRQQHTVASDIREDDDDEEKDSDNETHLFMDATTTLAGADGSIAAAVTLTGVQWIFTAVAGAAINATVHGVSTLLWADTEEIAGVTSPVESNSSTLPTNAAQHQMDEQSEFGKTENRSGGDVSLDRRPTFQIAGADATHSSHQSRAAASALDQDDLSTELQPTKSLDNSNSSMTSEKVGTACDMRGTKGRSHRLPADVERVDARIRKAYKQSTMELGLGVSSCGMLKSVEKVFVNLVMLPGFAVRDEFRDSAGYGSSRDLDRVEHLYGRAAREMASVNLADLFNVEVSDDLAGLRTSIRILVLASGGCGKTMVFLKYAPQQWALGHLWQQFSIVVAREFHSPEVQSAKNAIELLGLQTHGAVTPNSILSLDDYIHAHPCSRTTP